LKVSICVLSITYLKDSTSSLACQVVQSARVVGYAIWPGEFSVPPGISREQESQLVEEYQSKWREESLSWTKFEGSITRENEQVLDISDASLAISPSGGIAFQLCGHLNHAVYHEVFVRAETLEISGTDGTRFDLEKFQRMGELYWEAFSRDLHCHVCGKGPEEAKTLSKIGSAYICESCAAANSW
jgi:hypothetical protein